MAQTQPELKGIKDSWSLVTFARTFGPRMQVGQFANEDTGETFNSCVFTDGEGNRTFVSFSSKLGELTPREIGQQKDSLQVVQLNSGNYSLCKMGGNSWEDVDLGL